MSGPINPNELGGAGVISSLNRFLSATVLLTLAALNGVAQKPELVVQTGHSDSVRSIAFSPDGKTLASASSDHTIKLWDVATGIELRTLKGHSLDVNSVAFSPDGKTLASGSLDSTIKLWDVSTGAELLTLKAPNVVNSVAFSPDGKTLASGDSGSEDIKLWNLSTGAEVRTLRSLRRRSYPAVSVAFSPDGKTLASGSGGNEIKLWNVSTGAELRTFKGHADHPMGLSLAFSPDGKTLAGASIDVTLWSLSTGRELRTFKEQSSFPRSVAFSPDGKTLASDSSNSVVLWDGSTGAELRRLGEHADSVTSVVFSPDGQIIASGSDDKTVKIWNASTGSELRTLRSHSDSIFSIALSPDRKTLASAGTGHTVKLWDVSTGTEVHSLKGHSEGINAVAFSNDGKIIASGSSDKTVKLWDVATGAEVRSLTGEQSNFPASPFSAPVFSLAFSPDGKTLASGRVYITLWDITTGAEVSALSGHSNGVTSLMFSSDGKTLVSGSSDDTVKLWNVSTGAELRRFEAHSNGINSVAFSPDGRTVATGSVDKTIRLWDVSTGGELRTFKGHSDSVTSVAFSSDGKMLASGSGDYTIKLWDISSGTVLHTFNAHSLYVQSISFSPNNQFLLSGSWDMRIKVWEVSSGKELASLIALDENDWMVVTPDGLFDGSPAAWNEIIWRFNNNTFDYAPVEAFFNEFYYPGLLADIFAGKRPKAPSDISQKDRRQPQLRLEVVGEKEVDVTPEDLRRIWAKVIAGIRPSETKSVKVEITNAPAGAQDVRLFRNGSLVKLWGGDVLKGQSSVTLEATIPIVAGENRLTAYAFNHDNIKSSDATLTITGAESLRRKGVAYVLAVGVNKYANSQYNLKYAVADAQDFAEQLKLQQAKLNNYERVEVIALNDREATKANILKSLADLSAKIQPEDALIIYFAGHGTAQQNRFYLIPHDLGYEGSRTQLDSAGLQNILAHSVSDEELERAVEGIDAGQMLLVIDACNSGQALESEEKRRGPMNSKGLAQLAYEKGMYILTAAQSYQAAQEAARLGHGFLTYALVEEGLKTDRADRSPKDGQVLLREWLDYATERVPQMQQEKIEEQHKLGRQLELVIKFAESDAGTQRSVQRPRVFYRREAETSPLVVARP